MKKVTLLIAMAALVLFAGCKKDKEITGTTLKASIEQYKSGDNKTSIVPVGTEAEIRWTEGDQIVVNNGSTSDIFTLTNGQGTKNGTFTCDDEYTFGNNNIAVYPETATIEDNVITLELPAVQTYAAERNGANPMLATFTNPQNLMFKSLCGVLGISLKVKEYSGIGTITAIEVVSNSTDDKLNGTFTVNANATGDDLKLVKSGTDGTNSVRLNNIATLTSTPQNFYIALPVGALASGFTLNVYGEGDDPIFTKTAGNTTIDLNQVNQMHTLELVGNIIYLEHVTTDTTATNGKILTGTLGGNYKISIADGATVTLSDINITCLTDAGDWAGITCEGDATITLEGTNNVKSGWNGTFCFHPGIEIPEGKTLTINGSGAINASCYNVNPDPLYRWGSGAGIGGAYQTTCGNIIIESGTVLAEGGAGAAGIGSGMGGSIGNITIYGGTITAKGGDGGAGIGCGFGNQPNITPSSCGEITISGGNVTATGGQWAAGIGSGIAWGFGQSSSYGFSTSTCGNISITGGTVVATGGAAGSVQGLGGTSSTDYCDGGAGIGTGASVDKNEAGTTLYSYHAGKSNCGDITIGSGVTSVTATKGSSAVNSIGKNHSNNQGTCGTITIGGTVYPSGATPNQGDGLTFVYPVPAPAIPAGAINGLFSVSTTKQVWFSKGNLQNNGTFATNQYDLGGTFTFNNYSGPSGYYTLSYGEWFYLLSTRGADKRGVATVNSVKGLLILPDNWTMPDGCSFNPSATNNVYDVDQWAAMENAGAVFLPAAFVDICRYWSSTPDFEDDQCAFYINFNTQNPTAGFIYNGGISNSYSVRLVCNVE